VIHAGGGFYSSSHQRCYSRSNWWEAFFFCGGGGTMMIQQKKNPRTNGRKERDVRNQQQHVECITVGTTTFFSSFLYVHTKGYCI
jgi:hypothetical protein